MNQNGEVKNYYQHSAFGESEVAEENYYNRLRYNSQIYDELTSQYYLRARYYQPQIGRFTQEDILYNDGLNLYAYCQNNPVMYSDPSGYAKATNGCDPKVQGENALLRGDSALYSDTRPNGIRKSYISSRGNVVPANLSGLYKGRQVTVTEHILGGYRKGAKGNSPYTSFTFNKSIVKGYGNNLIEIDISGLRKAIQSGKVTNVAILSPKQIEKLIKNDKNQSDFWKKRALNWTKRDSEYLIKGEIPSQFVKIHK